MNKGSKIIIAILIVAAIVLAAILVMANREDNGTQPATQTDGQPTQQQQEQQPQNGQQQQPAEPGTEDGQQAEATITYTDAGFSPAQTTVPAGSTVEVVNESAATLELASDPHPAHTDNPDLNVGNVAPGTTAVFIVNEVGTWGYHDHLNPGNTGQITIE